MLAPNKLGLNITFVKCKACSISEKELEVYFYGAVAWLRVFLMTYLGCVCVQ